MDDILILTTHYNRAALLGPAMARLSMEAVDRNLVVRHIIADDRSTDEERRALASSMHAARVDGTYEPFLLLGEENLGRLGHWRLVTWLWEAAQVCDFRYAIMLADDLDPCEHFMTRVVRHFEFVRRQHKRPSEREVVAMTTLSSFPVLWGTSRYVDGHFVATRRFFELLDWEIHELPASQLPPTMPSSSGVWRQVTDRLHHHSQVVIAHAPGVSYVRVTRVPSVMFPSEQFPTRKNQADLVEHHYIDGGAEGF